MSQTSGLDDPGGRKRRTASAAAAIAFIPLLLGIINHPIIAKSFEDTIFNDNDAGSPMLGYVTFDNVWVTAYSSSVDETDSTPFITASGKQVGDGIIASNFLPFGTKVMIPEIFGNRIFTVEDRMHHRKKNFIDIWMPSKEMAKEFGIRKAGIYILTSSPLPQFVSL